MYGGWSCDWERRGKKCDQLFLDTHHFPCKEAWQLLCEQEGVGGGASRVWVSLCLCTKETVLQALFGEREGGREGGDE